MIVAGPIVIRATRAAETASSRPRARLQTSSTSSTVGSASPSPMPPLSARLAALSLAPLSMTPAAFAQFIAAETNKWAKVAKFAGIKQS